MPESRWCNLSVSFAVKMLDLFTDSDTENFNEGMTIWI